MLQAILVGLVVVLGKSDYFFGTAMFQRPLVMGALVGVVLGDVKAGVTIGFELELVFMGMQAIGAAVPPDMVVGSVLGTAFAISTNSGIETAVTIAMPAAMLSAVIVNLFYGVISPLMAKGADKYAEEDNDKGIERIFLLNGILFDVTFGVIAFVCFLFGGDAVSSLLAVIPDWFTNGVSIAAGILPAIGFAQLISMIANKQIAVFFFFGFLISAYLGISIIGIVCFSVVLVGILMMAHEFIPSNKLAQGGNDNDNEF